MTTREDSKKRARDNATGGGSSEEAAVVLVDDNNPPLTMSHIQERIRQLMARLPSKEETSALSIEDIPAMETWCRTVRAILRNYNLTLNFVAIANYQWEPDRPGHTGQSLAALRNQISLSTAQTNIVSSHISKILTPALDRQLMKKRTIERGETGEKEETYVYENVVNDPEMLQLNRDQLCDEALYKRQLMVSTMEQMCQCIDDYQKAEAGAAGGDGQRFSMAY
jgi:hypothetical protein